MHTKVASYSLFMKLKLYMLFPNTSKIQEKVQFLKLSTIDSSISLHLMGVAPLTGLKTSLTRYEIMWRNLKHLKQTESLF